MSRAAFGMETQAGIRQTLPMHLLIKIAALMVPLFGAGCATREPLSMALPQESLFRPAAREMIDQLPGLEEAPADTPQQRVQTFLYVPLKKHGYFGSVAYRDGDTLRTGKVRDRGAFGRFGLYEQTERPFDPTDWAALDAIDWPALMVPKDEMADGAPDGWRVLVQYWNGKRSYEFMVNLPYFEKREWHGMADGAISAAHSIIGL